MTIRDAATAQDFDKVRALLREYADWLQVDLCFQNFDKELAGLPGDYIPPRGQLLIAEDEGSAGGCIALRPIDDTVCEMKRLYVRPAARGTGLGKRLVIAITERAREIGYRRMRLDTLPKMSDAQRLYESLGFRDIEPYYANPVPGARFLELDLTSSLS